MMGQKLYQQSDVGIQVVSHREGHVRIPNYVYDIWMPLIGATAIGVYSVYCRVEMKGCVKKLSLEKIAYACRISKTKLEQVNKLLEKCRFINVTKPTGHHRLMHFTTQIDIYDPPRQVRHSLIEELQPERGYEPLTLWLFEDESVGRPTPVDEDDLPESPNIEDLGLNPLDIEPDSDESAPNGTTKVFHGWWDELKDDKANRPAVLMRMFKELYPEHDPPTYSRLGGMAKKVGAGQVASLFWQAVPLRPNGDVLAYVMGMKRNGGKPQRTTNVDANIETGRQWLESKGIHDN